MKNNLSQEQFQELYNQFLAMMNEKQQPKRKRPRKRPNGSGTINFLGKGRSRPWQPIVTIGTDDDTGKQIRKALPTCETREKAQESLDLYNLMNKGYVSESKAAQLEEKLMPTFAEIWQKVKKEKVHTISDDSLRVYETSFKRVSELHNIPINKIDLNILQPVFDKLSDKSLQTISSSKAIVTMCFDYAMKYDYITKNYSTYISLVKHKELESKHKAISKDTIKKIYSLVDQEEVAKWFLLYIYTGFRATEILELKLENINLEKGYIIGGKKTKAGTDRTVPIHPCIKQFVGELLLTPRKRKLTYHAFCRRIRKFNNKYNFDITLHDLRHTFATLCTEYGVHDYYAKCMLGHTHQDLTKDVYTHSNLEKLHEEIKKIPSPPHL